MLLREFCEIFKNSFLIEHLRRLLQNVSLHYTAVYVEHRKVLKEGGTLA